MAVRSGSLAKWLRVMVRGRGMVRARAREYTTSFFLFFHVVLQNIKDTEVPTIQMTIEISQWISASVVIT